MGLADIALTSSMRTNLLSLKNTSAKVDRTQERLATGKRVNSALDNPTNFFAAEAHLNRAQDLLGRKYSVNEAIQNINSANNGITAITALLQTASGIASAARGTNDQSSRTTYAGQFDVILSQIDALSNDSGYRGTNLLNDQSLTVDFAETTGQSTLTITGVDATSSGLGIEKTGSGTTGGEVTIGTGTSVGEAITQNFTYTGPNVNVGQPIAVSDIDISSTPNSTATVFEDAAYGILRNITTGEARKINPLVGDSVTGDSKKINVTLASVGTVVFSTGDTLQVSLGQTATPVLQRTFGTSYTAAQLSNIKVGGTLQVAGTDYNMVTRGDGYADIVFTAGNGPANGAKVTVEVAGSSTGNSWTSDANIQKSMNQVESALDTLRSASKQLSSSGSVLTTRLDFIDKMTGLLQTGSDNLTLADMNEEGANMLMLQTQQNLGVTSLSMASQSAQAVMRLF